MEETIMEDAVLKTTPAPDIPAAAPVNEVKVVFLGDGVGGKSHIIDRLANDGSRLTNYTENFVPDVSIGTKEYTLAGQKIVARLWQCNEPEILLAMHRVFLTERTLYVVAVNTVNDDVEARARYWLQIIQNYAPGAPVILVQNQYYDVPLLNEVDLRSKYANLKQVVKLSFARADREQFNREFTDVMLAQIRKMDHLRISWPTGWLQVKAALEQLNQNYTTVRAYHKICAQYGVNKDRGELLRWLNGLGVCAYFGEEYPKLREYIILRPEWLMGALSIILYNRAESAVNGRIPRSLLHKLLENAHADPGIHRLWPDARYDQPGDIPLISIILHECQLSFTCDDGTEFFPLLCGGHIASTVQDYLHDEEVLEFHMEFERLPDNLLSQLMCGRQQELDPDNVSRAGARFVQENTGCSAVLSIEGNRLKFYVRSGNDLQRPNTYLNQLKDNVDRIWKKMGIREPRAVVVYKEGGVSEEFDYQMLTEMLEAGDTHTFSMLRRRRIPIADILNQAAPESQLLTDSLLKDIVKACIQLQQEVPLFGADEETLNRILRDALLFGSYAAEMQELETISTTNSPGRPDLVLMNRNGRPLTSIEGLIIRNGGAAVREWDRHLEKLLTCYEPRGLPMLFLVSYAQCREEEYQVLWERYSGHMQLHSPKHCQVREASFREVKVLEEENPFLHVAQCDYYSGGYTVTVCHLFVRIETLEPELEWLEHPSETVAEPKHAPKTEAQLSEEEWPKTAPGRKPLPAQNKSALQKLLERLKGKNQNDGPAEQIPAPAPAEKPKPPVKSDPVLMEYRVVLLGDSEAGKSLILARLKDPQMDPAGFSGDTTSGIDIFSRVEDLDGKRVRVNYWDFGGQEILHSMHRMFLAGQTLYVIVLNTRNDNQDAQASFWLRYVQSYAPGAPVLLVKNKIDQNPRAALNLPVLRRQFNRVIEKSDVLPVCAVEKDPEVFRETFTKKLLERIDRCVSSADEFTPQQARIRDRVRQEKDTKQVMKLDEFLDICEDEGLKEKKQQEELMDRFHEAGIMVFFGQGKPMLLNPEWITEAIYKVLEKRDEITRNGIVSHDRLRTLFRRELGKDYASDDAEHVLKVMRAYGLSFLYEEKVAGAEQTEDREFIPMLCQREEPRQIEDLVLADGTIELQMVFEYLPGGVLHQLMVDNRNDLDKDLAWLSGAKFTCGGDNYAIVRRDGNVMSIHVNHAEKPEAVKKMNALADQIGIIAKHIKYRARLLETKIGFRIADITEYFDYDRLVKMERCDLPYIAAKTSGQAVAVQDILAQDDLRRKRELEELLRLTLVGCMDLQKDDTFWGVDENARNRQIARTIRQRFIVMDQTQGGKSGSGDGIGELDIEIRRDKDTPVAILEALNTTSTNTANWRDHLNKLMDNYNTSGLRCLILTSYIKCPKDKFLDKCAAESAEHWKKIEPRGFEGCLEYFGATQLEDCPELIHVTRAEYTRNNFSVSLYHFMVHIDEGKKKETPPVDKQ